MHVLLFGHDIHPLLPQFAMQRLIYICFTLLLSSFGLSAQTNITDSIEHQSYPRQFMVHLPPNFNPATPRALVVSLHGGSGNMVSAQGFSMLNPVADLNDFIVAWPQGYGIAPPGFSWADGRNTSADQAGIDDVGFLDKLIDTLVARYSVDTSRIYICGFSNGGFMVQRLACQLPERFAAMASLGASMDTSLYAHCQPAKPVPMAFFNGTADPAMPYTGGPMMNPLVAPVMPVDSMVQFWVSHNQCQTALPVLLFPDIFPTDGSTAELYRYTDCACTAEVAFFKLIDGGHTWPGVFIASQASVLGNTNRDIHGSVELWEFFRTHTLCQGPTSVDTPDLASGFSLYPNPASTTLHLQLPHGEGRLITIIDPAGQILFHARDLYQIDLASFRPGIYFLSVRQGSHTLTRKFIKE